MTLPNADEHEYGYDYRMRRITRLENGVGSAVVFSGGTSVAEYETPGGAPVVEYLRGPDMGGGVGGMLYSLRSGGSVPKYALSNGRGDVVAQSDGTGAVTWTASYEAYGKRPVETGTNADRQRANTKEEDPTGLLNEGFRYRDLDTGVWLSRDPAGFVDGPNLYAYVRQNPWTSFDPDGLAEEAGYRPTKNGVATLERGEKGNRFLTQMVNGVEHVYARHYTDWADRNLSWVSGPYGEPNSEGWQPASDFGLAPVNTTRKNFHTDNDPQASAEAWMDAASKPAVTITSAVAKGTIEISAMAFTLGASATGTALVRSGVAQAEAGVGGKFTVGAYNQIKGTVGGLDAHHVGQQALMKRLVPGYDASTAPSILVPKVGHTIRGANGIISRNTLGMDNVRKVMARDIRELRRVFPDVPNVRLQELIEMNKTLYPTSFIKPPLAIP